MRRFGLMMVVVAMTMFAVANGKSDPPCLHELMVCKNSSGSATPQCCLGLSELAKSDLPCLCAAFELIGFSNNINIGLLDLCNVTGTGGSTLCPNALIRPTTSSQGNSSVSSPPNAPSASPSSITTAAITPNGTSPVGGTTLASGSSSPMAGGPSANDGQKNRFVKSVGMVAFFGCLFFG